MTAQRRINLVVYAPALAHEDSRPLTVIRGVERALPGLRLEWTISGEGKLVPLPRIEAWLAQGRPTGRGFRLICNGDKSYRVTVSGWERPAAISSGGQAQFEVHAELPLEGSESAAAAEVLESLGEPTHAFWGCATPEGVAAKMAQQVRHSGRQPHVAARGLPMIKLMEDIRSPEIPHHLGRLNYWSAAAAQAIGFPDAARDGELRSRARRTLAGGWVVPLTEEPLDLDSPEHLDSLKRVYERFLEIGGRSIP